MSAGVKHKREGKLKHQGELRGRLLKARSLGRYMFTRFNCRRMFDAEDSDNIHFDTQLPRLTVNTVIFMSA